MKKWMMILAAAAATAVYGAGELPAPQKSGGMSLTEALNTRKTVRRYMDKELTDQQLADILWCANGVNRPNGKRTAPSAMDRREVMVFVAKKDGGYFYDAEKHALIKITDEDLRKDCGRFTAPCYLILVPDAAKQPKEVLMTVDCGYVSQNIYLAAQANGLGTCAIYSVRDRAKLAEKLKLGKNQPLLVHPLGIPR